MTDAGPVITFEELDALDADEVTNGYDDALEGLPEPASDASRAYWHGWRNGAVAAGYRQHDEATGGPCGAGPRAPPTQEPPLIPDALDIEKVANAMAATVGYRLCDMPDAARSQMRVFACAALVRLGMDARQAGKDATAATLKDAGAAMRAGAAALDLTTENAPEAEALVKYAARLDAVGAAILSTVPPSNPAAEINKATAGPAVSEAI